MTVLDAYAVLAYLRGEEAMSEVQILLRKPTAMCAANLSEVIDQLVRVDHVEPDQARVGLAVLVRSGLTVVAVSPEIALLAGELRARHHDRRTCDVSLADCLAAATALTLRRPLATADPALARVCLGKRGALHPLPDTAGRRPPWPGAELHP